MKWVAFFELRGFYAGTERALGSSKGPLVVMKEGRAWDWSGDAEGCGLRPGATARQVHQCCPSAELAEYEPGHYRDRARQICDLYASFTPRVEPVDFHQAFLDLSGKIPPAGEVERICRSLAPRWGFEALAGVASSKLIARAAVMANLQSRRGNLGGPNMGGRPSSESPKSGHYRVPKEPCAGNAIWVQPGTERAFLAPLPLDLLWPVDVAVHRRLKQLGLSTIGDVAQIPEIDLIHQFGPRGRLISRWSLGVDEDEVRAAYPPHNLEHRLDFRGEVGSRLVLESALSLAAGNLTRRLQRKEEGFQRLTLEVGMAGGISKVKERVFPRPQGSLTALETALLTLLQEALSGTAEPVVGIKITLGELQPLGLMQLDLLDDLGGRAKIQREQEEKLDKALNDLRKRFPSGMVGLGCNLPSRRREERLRLVDPFRFGDQS